MSLRFAQGAKIGRIELFLEWNSDFRSPLRYSRDRQEDTVEFQWGPLYLSIDRHKRKVKGADNGTKAADESGSLRRGVP